MNPSRRRLAAVVAALTVAAVLGGSSLGVSMATAQSSDAQPRDYQPCDPNGTSTVDLLLVIDQSSSLNRPEVDEGGEIRREALRRIRGLLEGEWVLDDDGSPRGIRLALVGFDTSVHYHAPSFEPAATGADPHPSDEEIEAAVQSPSGEAAFTDYGEALRAALDVFDNSRSDCRVMVWFTDGLHNPVPGRTPAEIEGARELRDEVCGTIQPQFEQTGIQTFAVLLGSEFRDPEQPEMADLSMAIIHAVTGHRDSPEVADLPRAVRCDGIDTQTGEILTAEDVGDLINTLIKAVLPTDPRIWQWPCDAGRDGSETSDIQLPSSTYIDWMEVLAFGGEIESYAVLDLADFDWQPLEQRRLRLESDDLQGLSAGWTLKMRVRPDDGATPESVSLECYGKAVDQPLRMHASVLDGEGQELSEVPADEMHALSVYMWPYECPVDDGEFVLVPQFPARALPNRSCEHGQYAEFAYSCGAPETRTRVTSFTGELTPRFSENLVRGGLELEVEVSANFVCLPRPTPPTTTTTTTTTTPPPPTLDCDTSQQVDGEWVDEEFFGDVMVECIVAPPTGGSSGSGAVDVTTPSDGWDFRIEGAGGADRRTIDSSDLPANVVVVEDLPRQGPWDRMGEVEVALEWTQPEGAGSQTIGVGPEHPGWVDPLEFYPYWPTLQCSEVEEVRFEGDVPQEPLRAATQCAASGPGMGSLQLTLRWTVAADAPTRDLLESVDWGFQRQSESGEGAVLVLLTESERLDPISFVTAGPLENERYEGDGTLTMTAVWLLPWDEQRPIIEVPIEVPIEVDLMRRAIWWLAALLVVAAALVTYTLLYAIMARSARLPSAKRFFARRLEFQAHMDRAGNLTSAALDNISMDADRLVNVKGDRNTLRVEDLSIRAEHPRWSQFNLILDGGWGRPSLKSGRHIFGTHPAHSRGISSTAAQFTHLAVIALRTAAGAPPGAASGIAYLLVPKSAHDAQATQFVAEVPNDVLRRMTATYLGEVGQTPGDPSEDAADPGPSQPPAPPPRAPSGPPPRDPTQDSAPPPRDRTQDGTPAPRRPRQSRDRPEEPPPRGA